jgi:hypothetical protein
VFSAFIGGCTSVAGWLPALAADEQKGRSPLNEEMHFHDVRHTHETWLIEDRVPGIMRLVRLGHKRKGVDDITEQLIETCSWPSSRGGSRTAGEPGPKPRCGTRSGVTSSERGMWSADRAPHLLPKSGMTCR